MSVVAEGVGVRAEGPGGRRRRRSWSEEAKRGIVAETLEPGASVSIVARQHDVNANQVFSWRRQLGAEPQSFVPVVVPAEATSCRAAASVVASGAAADFMPAGAAAILGRMEIVLACGSRVVVDASVDGAALARVLKTLRRQ